MGDDKQDKLYSIREDLRKNPFWDAGLELRLFSRRIVITIGLIFSLFVALLIGLQILQLSIFKYAQYWDILFIIGYGWLLYLLIMPTRTGDAGIKHVIPMIRYMQGEGRVVDTRRGAPAAPVYELFDYDSIADDGTIHFLNDDVGRIYEVSGNASEYTFSNIKRAVIGQYNVWLHDIPQNVQIHFYTLQSAQRVTNQVAYKNEQLADFPQNACPDLYKLLKLQRYQLKVNVEKQFTHLRQFMLVRTVDMSTLLRYSNGLDMFVSSQDGAAFKDIRLLNGKASVENLLHNYNCVTQKPL